MQVTNSAMGSCSVAPSGGPLAAQTPAQPVTTPASLSLSAALDACRQALQELASVIQRMVGASAPAQAAASANALSQLVSAPTVTSGGGASTTSDDDVALSTTQSAAQTSTQTATQSTTQAAGAGASTGPRVKVGPNQQVPGTNLRTDAKGDLTIDQAGAVVDGIELAGVIRVKAPNVTIRNSTITGPTDGRNAPTLIEAWDSRVKNLVVENSVLRAAPGVIAGNAIHGSNYTARNNDISRTIDGLGVFTSGGATDANVVIEGNYIHDVAWYNAAVDGRAGGTHNDGIQIHGGRNIVIRNNRIDIRSARDVGSLSDAGWKANGMQGIMVQQITAPTSDVLIEGNTIGGGTSGVHLFSKAAGSLGAITVRNNTFPLTNLATGGTGMALLISGVANPASLSGADTNRLGDGATISKANGGIRNWVK